MASNGYVPPFGAVLKYYRLDLQLTQEELAEQAGVSRLTISALERGVRRAPHRDTVRRLSDAMRLPARDRERLETSARRVDHGAWATALNDAPSRDIPASPPLAGRRHEIDAVERHVEGRGAPLLVLAGEPGIGKTRLLQEAASHARLYGVRVLAAGSERQRLQEPYTPIVGALGHHFLGLDPASRRAALARRPWLTRLLPEHTGDLSAELPVLPAHEERRLMFEAVVGHLTSPDAEGGGGTFGTLLMLDDLQWAGPDALELMDRLVRHAFMPGRVPLWLLGAYRDTEVAPGDPLARMLGDLLPSRLATQLPIGPLDQKESQQLLELLLAGTESQRADSIGRRAHGVPFYLVSYAQALRSGTIAGAEDLPLDILQSIQSRIAALPGEPLEVLGAAALIDPPVPNDLLLAVTGGSADRVLEAAFRARLLVAEGEDGSRFAHEMIRSVVLDTMGSVRRAVLRRRIERITHDDRESR